MPANIAHPWWRVMGVLVLLGLGAVLPRHHVVAAPLTQTPPPAPSAAPVPSGSPLASPSPSGSASPSPAAPPPSTGWFGLPNPLDLARQAWQEALYAIERLVATFFWTIDRAILNVISLVERFRGQLVTMGFRPVIQTVADTVVQLAPSILLLGFVLGMLLILLRPALDLRLVNVRKVLVYAAIIPVLFPLAGATFQNMEETRADFGNWFFNTGASLVGFNLGGGGTPAPTATMAQVVPYDPTLYGDSTVRHGIDVAAAYVYATKDDVLSARDLPDAFEKTYFPLPDLTSQTATQRWDAIKTAAQGIVRASFGILLVLVALCESTINVVFTIGLGFLLIGFAIGLVLSWFSPVEAITARIGQEIIQVFIGSWGISVAQGLLIAALLAVAQSGNADAVFGMGVVALVLECIFLVAAAKTLFNGFAGATGALTGGTVSPEEVAVGGALAGGAALLGAQSAYGTIRAVERGGGALVNGAVSAAGGAVRVGSTFRYARQLNDGTRGSTRLALGAAMSQSPSLAQAGTLATLMGFTQPGGDFERGLTTGVVGGRGQPLRTRAALRSDAQDRLLEAFDQGITQMNERTMRDDQVARAVSWAPSPPRNTDATQPLAPPTSTAPPAPAPGSTAPPRPARQGRPRQGPRAQRAQGAQGQPVVARAQQRRQQRVAAEQTQRQAARAQRWQAQQQRHQARPQHPSRGRRFMPKVRPAPLPVDDAMIPDTTTATAADVRGRAAPARGTPPTAAPRMRSTLVLMNGGARPQRRTSTAACAQQPTITLGERTVRQSSPQRQAPAPLSAAPRIVTTSTPHQTTPGRRAPRRRSLIAPTALRAALQRRTRTTILEEQA